MRSTDAPLVRIPWPSTWTWITLAAVGFVVWGLVSDPGASTDPEALFDPEAGTTEKLRAAEYWVTQGTAAAPRMVAALRSEHEDTRAQAAYVLGRIGREVKFTLPDLIVCLHDESPKVRGNALYSLHQISADRNHVAAQAGDLLADEDMFVRETAGEVLAQCGEAALPNALRLTRHDSPQVREAALRLLSEIAADRRAVQDVARLYLTDADPAVRMAAFTVLDRGRALSAADLLVGLGDADSGIREIVLQQHWPSDEATAAAAAPKLAALLELGLQESELQRSELIETDYVSHDVMHGDGAEDEATDDDSAAPGHLTGMDPYDPGELLAVLRVLQTLGRPAAAAAPQVAALAESSHPRLRQTAVQTLTRLIADPTERLELLEPLVRDADDRVAHAAARAVADCPPDTVDALIASLGLRFTANDPTTRRSAAAALCGLSPLPQTLPVFRSALDDRDPQVRFWMIRGLGAHGPEAASDLPELVDRLRGDLETTGNQAELLVALRHIGPAARPALPELLEKYGHAKSPSQCAIEALRTAVALAPEDRIVQDFARSLFRTSRSGRLRAEALRTAWLLEDRDDAPHNTPADDELIRLTAQGLTDANPRVRVTACGLLAERGSRVPEALAADLAELVEDEDAMVRYMACRALEAVGPRAAVAVPALMVAVGADENSERWVEVTTVEPDRELVRSLKADRRASVRDSARAALKSIAPEGTFAL